MKQTATPQAESALHTPRLPKSTSSSFEHLYRLSVAFSLERTPPNGVSDSHRPRAHALGQDAHNSHRVKTAAPGGCSLHSLVLADITHALLHQLHNVCQTQLPSEIRRCEPISIKDSRGGTCNQKQTNYCDSILWVVLLERL